MKKFLSTVLVLALALTFTACVSNTAKDSHGDETWSKDWGITLTAEQVTASGMTLICSQSGGIAEGSLETGSEYWIETLENDTWVTVQPLTEPVWDMMAHLIPSGESVRWEIDWTWLYGELNAGTYRICKIVTDFKESGASESQVYCAEFEIKE